MIKGLVAITEEIDEIDQAVSEILEQINPEKNLKTNSVGLLSCYTEFIDSGVVEAICKALPFDIIGATTCMTAIPEKISQMGLSLCVLTSDDVEFSVAISEKVTDGSVAPFEEGYKNALSRLSDKPKTIIGYMPLMMNVAGDMFVEIFDKISGGVPLFGCVCVDSTQDYHLSRTIYNGQEFADRAAYVLISGDITPKFSIVTVSPEKIGYARSVVTRSMGPQLIEVDNRPVVEFFKNSGFIASDGTFQNAMNAYPLIVEHEEISEPILRVAFAMTPDGHAVCGGNIPEGASITVGNIDGNEIVKSTEKVLTKFIEDNLLTYMQMYACVGRFYCLGYEPEREALVAADIAMRAGVPFGLTYAGGELCPQPLKDRAQGFVNLNHNDSFIVCGF